MFGDHRYRGARLRQEVTEDAVTFELLEAAPPALGPRTLACGSDEGRRAEATPVRMQPGKVLRFPRESVCLLQ